MKRFGGMPFPNVTVAEKTIVRLLDNAKKAKKKSQ